MIDLLNAIVALANFVIVPAISYGSQLALGALGVTLIYGILRFSNFAHGDTMAFGAMATILATWALQSVGINLGIFPKLFYGRCQYNQFTIVGNGHPGPVYTFISQPGTLKLFRLQVNHHLFLFSKFVLNLIHYSTLLLFLLLLFLDLFFPQSFLHILLEKKLKN